MNTTMTYNDIYFNIALLNDLAELKLPAKATTERLLLRAHYSKPHREFEDIKETILKDEASDDEAKNKAVAEKAQEEIAGFKPRYFSEAALEQIVAAVTELGDDIQSQLAGIKLNEEGNPVLDEDGKPQFNEIKIEGWLNAIVERFVEV